MRHKSLSVLVGLLAMPVVAVAQSLEWNPIDAQESYLIAPGLAGEDGHLRRQAAQKDGSLIEFWNWPSGSIFLQVLPGNKHFQNKKRSHLTKNMHKWNFLKDIDLSAHNIAVERSKNRLGSYYYLVSTNNNAGLTCFVFLQNLPNNVAAGYEESPDTAGGVLEGFDCQPSSEQSAADYGKLIAGYVDAIVRNKNR